MSSNHTRAIAIGAGALGLAVVLGILGMSLAMPIVEWKMAMLDLDQLVIASPAEPGRVELATAILFGWPAIVGGVAATIHHVRRGPPPVKSIVIYFVIPALALAAITVLMVWSYKSGATNAAAISSGIKPMFSLASLGPGGEEAKVGAFVAAVLWLYVVVKRPT